MYTVVYGPLWYDYPSDFHAHISHRFKKRTLSAENISLKRSAFPVGFLVSLQRKPLTSTRRALFANWAGGSGEMMRSGKLFAANGGRHDMVERALSGRAGSLFA
jgi:hypothetical protein